MTKYNIWFFSSLFIAIIVSLPIITVFFSFFNETSNYFTLLRNTFLFDYIFNSMVILFFVIKKQKEPHTDDISSSNLFEIL